MMLLKLTLLGLLIAVPNLHVSGAKLPCSPDSKNCRYRHIRIISAFYGRVNTVTCAAGRPHNQIRNTHCSAPHATHQVGVRCNGRCICQVPASNYIFSDPCYGTYKYLQISYDCK